MPLVLLGILAITVSCQRGGSTGGGAAADTGLSPSGLPYDVVGEITFMTWGGDDTFYEDLGTARWTSDDIRATNPAMIHATALEFKKIFPNVTVNIFAMSGDPNAGVPWEQHRENFRMQYGRHADVYVVTDMIGDIQRGLIADLSMFRDIDPMLATFNPGILDMLTIEGRLFALPQYIIPRGIWVNRSLADANNIDVPDPDWTIEEFTRFITNHRPNEWYGSMGGWGDDLHVVRGGTRDFNYQLMYRQPGEPFVNINGQPTRDLLRVFNQWRHHTVHANNDAGLVTSEFMSAHGNWGWRFFFEGSLLTFSGEPWNLGSAANPDSGNRVRVADWDIYPMPSTQWVGNHVGLTNDPWVIRNFAMDDGNPALNEEEELKLRIAYEFVRFFGADTRAWESRRNTMFLTGGGVLSPSMNISLPFVTGPEFDKQMEIWYSLPQTQAYRNRNAMPGWHYVMELWQAGQLWDISDKAFPWFYDFEGGRRTIIWEWNNAWNPDVTGAVSTDPNWLDQIYSRLPIWNTAFNERWEVEMVRLNDALNRYYPLR
ncbi:MAG: ABC transporter substrate-binding protein [Treponema sp.]|nr:ABC transporter substrate-binding protein [Treponema sp.]